MTHIKRIFPQLGIPSDWPSVETAFPSTPVDKFIDHTELLCWLRDRGVPFGDVYFSRGSPIDRSSDRSVIWFEPQHSNAAMLFKLTYG